MVSSIALSPTELQEVTGYKIPGRQIDALNYMDIPFKVRPNGTVFVARSIFDNTDASSTREEKPPVAVVEDW